MYKEPVVSINLTHSLLSGATALLHHSVTPLMSKVGPYGPLLCTMVFLTCCSPGIPLSMRTPSWPFLLPAHEKEQSQVPSGPKCSLRKELTYTFGFPLQMVYFSS